MKSNAHSAEWQRPGARAARQLLLLSAITGASIALLEVHMGKAIGWIVSAICALVFILASLFSGGCAAKATLSLDETMADGSTFALHYAARGDGIVNQSVEYNGEGADPWRLGVNSDARIESPAQLALAAGAGELLAALPDIIEDLLPVLDVLNSTAAVEAPGMLRSVIESLLRSRLEGFVEGLANREVTE